MIKTAIRTPEGAREILEYNIGIIYHLPEKYKYVSVMLKDVRKELLKILNYIKDVKPIIYKQKYVWYLDSTTLTAKIKMRTTRATCSRHFNYLCCLGLLNKIEQTQESMIGINREFMIETGSRSPMNVISVYRYTEKELDRIEERAKLLRENKITPGNISFNRLMANGCCELAREVFFANAEKAVDKKQREFKQLMESLEVCCSKEGYTTKGKLYSVLPLKSHEIDRLFQIFKEQIWKTYTYKAPTKQDIEKYELKTKKWIIIKKEI